ncbi:MAG: hypothetical protein R3F17_17260 [Planctomycetota bacterium]
MCGFATVQILDAEYRAQKAAATPIAGAPHRQPADGIEHILYSADFEQVVFRRPRLFDHPNVSGSSPTHSRVVGKAIEGLVIWGHGRRFRSFGYHSIG